MRGFPTSWGWYPTFLEGFFSDKAASVGTAMWLSKSTLLKLKLAERHENIRPRGDGHFRWLNQTDTTQFSAAPGPPL